MCRNKPRRSLRGARRSQDRKVVRRRQKKRMSRACKFYRACRIEPHPQPSHTLVELCHRQVQAFQHAELVKTIEESGVAVACIHPWVQLCCLIPSEQNADEAVMPSHDDISPCALEASTISGLSGPSAAPLSQAQARSRLERPSVMPRPLAHRTAANNNLNASRIGARQVGSVTVRRAGRPDTDS